MDKKTKKTIGALISYSIYIAIVIGLAASLFYLVKELHSITLDNTPRTINKYVFIKEEPPAWPTPYPDNMGAINISQEGCEKNRYSIDSLSPRMLLMWEENADELIDNYELLEFIYEAVSSTVASHSCSIYDPSYDDDHFWWAQLGYHFIDALQRRFYDEKYWRDVSEPARSPYWYSTHCELSSEGEYVNCEEE